MSSPHISGVLVFLSSVSNTFHWNVGLAHSDKQFVLGVGRHAGPCLVGESSRDSEPSLGQADPEPLQKTI